MFIVLFCFKICLFQKKAVLLWRLLINDEISMLFGAQIHDLKMLLPWVRIRREKAAMRAVVEQKRRMMSPEEVAEQSGRIIAQIEQMSVFREAQTVLLYYPIHNEVDLRDRKSVV